MRIRGKTYGSYLPEEKCDGSFTEQSVRNGLIRNRKSKTSSYAPTASFCFCNCERQKWELGDVRAISLKWELAEYKSNRLITRIPFEVTFETKNQTFIHYRIITNLKFGGKNGLIRLEIETGFISQRGKIDQLSVFWENNEQPVPDINHESNSPTYVFNVTHAGKSETLYKWIENRDFVYVTKNLSMNLDDIVAPENHVIIGKCVDSLPLKFS